MQIGAANWPQMMQIVVGIMTKSCKSALISEWGRINANQGLRQPAKLSGDAPQHHLTMSNFSARLGYT